MEDHAETANRQGGLKVIGAGFGRTGTLSLKVALEELGFASCYHMTEVFNHPQHIPLWGAATRGEAIDWNALFQGYQATVDWPGCSFYEQLMQVYPDAKVLLTVRDPEKWYESVRSTIYQVSVLANRSRSRSPSFRIMRLLMPSLVQNARMTSALIWQKTFHDRFDDKQYAIEVFNRHNEEVKRKVPPEKLLVYDVKEGWEPLCAFLGVEVPADKPFPHLNDRSNFVGTNVRERMRQRLWQENRARVGKAVLGIGLVAALFLLFRQITRRA